MVSLHKGFGSDIAAVKSFEEIYKSAYSHGLESIYAIENVDISSIRRLQDNSTHDSKAIERPRIIPQESPQLTFDFDEGFCEWFKHSIDYAAWIRCITEKCSCRKRLYLALDAFEMGNMVALTPTDLMEIRRLTADKKNLWRREGVASLSSYAVQEDMRKVSKALILPWMDCRMGLASRDELLERLERISTAPAFAKKAFHFFTSLYGDFVDEMAIEVEDGIYVSSEHHAEAYRLAQRVCEGYFYKRGLSYGLTELVGLISRECARQWVGFPDGFLEKTLRMSPKHVVFKGVRGLRVKGIGS